MASVLTTAIVIKYYNRTDQIHIASDNLKKDLDTEMKMEKVVERNDIGQWSRGNFDTLLCSFILTNLHNTIGN